MSATMNFSFHTQAEASSKYFSNEELKKSLDFFKSTVESKDIGFFRLSDKKRHLDSAKAMHKKHAEKTHFIQIGIGGSALGPQTLIDALGSNEKVKFFFMDNTDSEHISDTLKRIDPKKSLFYVVSKSGGTAETMANFAIARNFLLEAGIKKEEFKNHFVLCTDPESGHLRELAEKDGLDALEVPSDIGGRFSVFTHVGLFPALFAGIDIDELFAGANDIKKAVLSENMDENFLVKTGAHIAELFETHNVNQTVLMPYSSKLKTLSHWFVQLWGESLGKIRKSDGKNVGLTPIPAYGATDQHSQMQLFMEGPSDKVLMLLEVKNKTANYELKSDLDLEPAKKLESYNINQLIEAQINGTLKALSDNRKNVIHISIERNDARHMGAMVLFFECLTALMGRYLDVNPFDQPGVELGKKYAYEYLKNLG